MTWPAAIFGKNSHGVCGGGGVSVVSNNTVGLASVVVCVLALWGIFLPHKLAGEQDVH